jgi:plasmid stabilization system protein ParE
MEGTKSLPVRTAVQFISDIQAIYVYGVETFGKRQADIYENEIWRLVEGLSDNYLIFPECRHLITKSKMYRWIILESHLIIYRITKKEVQVLRILHSTRSVSNLKSARKVK